MNWFSLSEVTIGEGATAEKIRSFSSLRSGWRYGSGIGFEPQTIQSSIKLLYEGNQAGLLKNDAFPGAEGDIAVAFYKGKSRFEFTVNRVGSVSYLHEDGDKEIDCDQELSMDEAVTKIQNLGLWNLYFCCTSLNTMRIVNGSAVPHSRNQARSSEEESQLSTGFARWIQVTRSVPILEDSIQGLPTNRRSSGNLTRPSCLEPA